MTKENKNFKEIDLDSSHEHSWARVTELKANRREDEIPLSDEYWKALQKHQAAYQKGTLK